MQRMPNLVDIALVLVALLGLVTGWRRGFLLGAVELAMFVVVIAAALWGAVAVAQRADHGVWGPPLAFIGIVVVARLVLGALATRLMRRVPATIHRHAVNRLFGLLPGAAHGLINAMLLAMLLIALPLHDAVTRQVQQSALAERLALPAERLAAWLSPVFDPAIDRSLARWMVRPESTTSLPLPFSVAAPRARPDLEARMLQLVNAERRAAGLAPLRADSEATAVARAHSVDMFARSYFSHVSPDGDDAFARMRAAGLRFLAAGENLALARTLPLAHQGLMESPGHRANILRPHFGRVGIGIVDGGRHGLMVTQKFRN